MPGHLEIVDGLGMAEPNEPKTKTASEVTVRKSSAGGICSHCGEWSEPISKNHVPPRFLLFNGYIPNNMKPKKYQGRRSNIYNNLSKLCIPCHNEWTKVEKKITGKYFLQAIEEIESEWERFAKGYEFEESKV